MKNLIVLAVCVTGALAIIGGKEAKEGEYPYQVSIKGCITGICEHGCGGTILNKRWILTAARCIKPYPSWFYTYQALIGSLSMFVPGLHSEVIEVDKEVPHPQYNDTTTYISAYDIALFHLKKDITFTNFTQPATLPAANSQPAGESILTGWGYIANAPNPYTPPIQPMRLQTVDVPIIGYKDCYDAVDLFAGEAALALDKSRTICTGPLDKGISMCRGDEGSPLSQNGTVVGVASWGLSPCGQVGAPTVYTNVGAYVDWINSVINSE